MHAPLAAYAAFDDLGAGARSAGMGNAFTALADDAFGFYYNPAGLGHVRQGQIASEYGKLWVGLSDRSDLSRSFVAGVVPIFSSKRVEVAVAVSTSAPESVELSTGSQKTEFKTVSTHVGTVCAAWQSFALQGYYQESAYYVGFGKSHGKLAWGCNVKMLQEKYTIDSYMERSPVFDYGAKSSVQNYSFDAGVLYNISPRFFIGASGSDLNQPDMGLSSPDRIRATARVGLGWRQKDIKWDVDGICRGSNWYGAAGVEKWFKNFVGIRTGLSLGGRNFAGASAGFSVNLSAVRFDYACQLPLTGIRDTAGSHRISFIYRFGRTLREELEPGSLEYYYARLQDEISGLKDTLAETEAEKKKLEEVLIEEATSRIRERIKAAKAGAREPRSTAPSDSPDVKERKETSHIVQRGETLQSIAQRYYRDEKYWNEIYQVNKESVGRGGVLKPGQVLIIPPLSHSETPVAAGAAPEVVPVRIVAPVEVAVPVPSAAPPLPEPVQIKVIPVMPSPETRRPPAAKEAQPAAVKEKRSGPRTHLVQKGENLQSIARKYYNDAGRWKEIYEANKSKAAGGQLSPGQEITIP
ncbi:MAG: hypothetical protein A2314_08955 [Elusimicrobia bacterium RIFOXYB2_FULL_50_12]|nr:MAG: hypothetical protein A2314_08955 [Elusimicrobia bacterium RIFOXYB2_FULL_50_12]